MIEALSPRRPLAARLYAKICSKEFGQASEGNSPAERRERSSGTGWPLPAGFVVTNNHVVSGAGRIRVLCPDGVELTATVLSADPANDLALLKVDDPSKLPSALPLCKMTPQTGEGVFTLGYPHPSLMGVEAKLADGVISAQTGIGNDVRAFQITVPLQGGNSGGPLFNMKGEVVGVAVAMLDAAAVFSWPGDLPENVAYAIKIPYLEALLSSVPKGDMQQKTLPSGEGALPELVSRVGGSMVLIVA